MESPPPDDVALDRTCAASLHDALAAYDRPLWQQSERMRAILRTTWGLPNRSRFPADPHFPGQFVQHAFHLAEMLGDSMP
eukprot:4259951-Amphidinium_carterae.1